MLLDHNKEAYDAVKAMLLEHRECCLVAATGIGKSNIAAELIKELNLNAIVIAPKRSIRDNWAEMPDKYGFPATISTVTYQYFTRHYRKMYGFDIYVFDEAQHADSKKWGEAIRRFREKLTVEFVLGLTADPVRYSDKYVKNKNIVQSLFNGHAVYGHSTNSAIENGILPNASYICALFDTKGIIEMYEQKDMTDELRGRLRYTKANCEAIEVIIRRHAPKKVPIKGIVFVDSINNVGVGMALVRQSFPDKEVYSIHSDLSAEENAEALSAFKRAESGFIVAIDMLNEGLHIEGVNMIIMLRKTSSPTIYMQQIGRGLAAHGQYITIYDLVRNDTSIKEVLSRITDIEERISHKNNRDDREPYNIRFSLQSIIKNYTTDILKVLEDIDKYNSKNNLWSEEEDKILRENYPSMGKDVYKLLPGRTMKACVGRARTLGIYVMSSTWSEEEDKILRENYPSMGKDVYKLLPDRSCGACYQRARILGIKYSDERVWSEEEDKILRENYPSMGGKVCKLLPGRTKTSCKHRAMRIGLVYENTWSEEEDKILIENYPSMGRKVAKMLPNRTEVACSNRAIKLSIEVVDSAWSEEEDKILRENYPSMGGKVCKLLPGRTKTSCMARAGMFCIRSNRSVRPWTNEEDNIIRENYPSMGKGVHKLLSDRTPASCSHRAVTLNIKCNSKSWSEEEDKILRENYPSMGRKVAELLPGRSKEACIDRANKILKIKYNRK